MSLLPEVKQMIDMMASLMPSFVNADPAAIRAMMDAPMGGETGPIGSVEDRAIPGPASDMRARIYRPVSAGSCATLAFFHGGGFVVGSLDTHDALCRELCHQLGAVVVSVDYRLAPEHPFPAAPEDAYAATCWVAEHIAELGGRADRLVVAGDSAGGNLAAVVCLMARDRSGPAIAHQLLMYPVTDHSPETGSRQAFATGYFLTQEMMTWFSGHYLQSSEDNRHPLAAPLHAADLAGLPPATVITAAFDPLRDEGEAYAEKLRAAGVPVTLRRVEGTIHGFLSMLALPHAKVELEQLAGLLKPALA